MGSQLTLAHRVQVQDLPLVRPPSPDDVKYKMIFVM